MKKINSFYDNRIVYKPWGYEYVVYRNLNYLCVTLLSIDYEKTTSLHCHPKKKVALYLLAEKLYFNSVFGKNVQKFIHHHQNV